MNRFLIVALIVLFAKETTTAQTMVESIYEFKQAFDFFDYNKSFQGNRNANYNETSIHGSPYLKNRFALGSVITNSNIKYMGIPLRYNIYNDQFEFISDDGTIQALAVPETIRNIEFDEYQLEYIPFYSSNNISYAFFIVKIRGSVTLYSRPQVMFQEARSAGAFQTAQPPRFIRRADKYYIRAGTEPANQITGRKSLEKLFPDHKNEVALFIKENRVNPKRVESLINLVDYYNSLE